MKCAYWILLKCAYWILLKCACWRLGEIQTMEGSMMLAVFPVRVKTSDTICVGIFSVPRYEFMYLLSSCFQVSHLGGLGNLGLQLRHLRRQRVDEVSTAGDVLRHTTRGMHE